MERFLSPAAEYGCVIMASGLGQRFGGNKLMADFCGTPLICRILNATEGLFGRRVVVTRHRDVADLCRSRGIQTVVHALPHRSDTIRLGLDALGDGLKGCLFCPVDQPLLKRQTLIRLLLSAQQRPDRIWRPAYGDTAGAPVLFPAWALEALRHLPEGKGGGWLLRQHPDLTETVPVRSGYELADADTPDMLEQLALQASRMTQARWLQNGHWVSGEAADLLLDAGRVISLVGGGGKTSTLFHLASASAARGERCAVLTTTKMYLPSTIQQTPQDCFCAWQQGHYAICGQALTREKMGPPDADLLAWLLTKADRLIIEADGARTRPCKMPRDGEPVLLPECDCVAALAGLDALGQPVDAVCHRPELVCDFLGCEGSHQLTATDLARMLASTLGGRKDVNERNYWVILNKCDNAQRQAQGEQIAALLHHAGVSQVLLHHFAEEERA